MKTALDPRKLKLTRGKIVVEIDNNARMGNVIVPDGVRESNNLARILHWAYKPDGSGRIDVNLPPGTKVGDYVLIQSRPIARRSVPFEEPFNFCDIITDDDVMGVVQNGIMFPVGTKLLVIRMNEERINPGGKLIIPGAQPSTDQSHWVKLIRRGLPRYHWKKLPAKLAKEFGKKKVWQMEQFEIHDPQFMPGVIGKLKGWGEHMREVAMPGERYMLIINEDDIAGYYPIGQEPPEMKMD